ncbi:unnamed protein product, partial [Phaeothamnion confervicola]
PALRPLRWPTPLPPSPLATRPLPGTGAAATVVTTGIAGPVGAVAEAGAAATAAAVGGGVATEASSLPPREVLRHLTELYRERCLVEKWLSDQLAATNLALQRCVISGLHFALPKGRRQRQRQRQRRWRRRQPQQWPWCRQSWLRLQRVDGGSGTSSSGCDDSGSGTCGSGNGGSGPQLAVRLQMWHGLLASTMLWKALFPIPSRILTD